MRRYFSSARFALLLLAGVLASALSACGQPRPRRPSSSRSAMPPAPFQTEKFRLSAGPCAPKGYPARIDEARFSNSLGGGFPVPYGHLLEGSWGKSGIGWAVGDLMKPVPDSLELRWFSYTEDKFYQGRFLLPQERLYKLLKAGRWDPEGRRKISYETLIVCVVPTGAVVVWLSSGSTKVLIGRYQAHEIEYDFNIFNRAPIDRAQVVRDIRAELPAAVQADIKAGRVSAAQWDAYLKRYPWQLEFSRPLTLFDHGIGYRSAELTGTPLTADLAAYAQELLAPSPKPVPSYVMLYLAGAYGRKRLLKVSPFDEAETMAAFQTLVAKHPGQVITLHVEIDEELKRAALSLRAGGQTLPLTKSVIQFFDLRQ